MPKQCEVVSRVEFIKGDVQEILKKYRTIKKWAYIIHDKDDTPPHYHIYLNFDRSSIDFSTVAGWFGIDAQFVSKVHGRASDMLLYLTHGNNSQKNKYQYSPTEVVANFDFEVEISNDLGIGYFEKFSYAQQLQYVNSLPMAEKLTAFTKLEKHWKIHCQALTLEPNRHVEVMFIQGKGGTGKTFYAKKFLASRGLDFCVSSSSNDPFQDYLGQKAIILDDFRDNCFEFADFLKILDNETASTIKSRFTNKVFNGEMIVITSSVPLEWWYRYLKYNKDDTLTQLYRRISCYVVVTKDFVEVFDDGVDLRTGRPAGLARVFKNEVPALVHKKEKKTDFGNAFGEFLEDAMPDIIDEKYKTRPGG